MAEIVCVGKNSGQVHIDRQRVGAFDDVILLAGGNIDGRRTEDQHKRILRRRLVGEIKADRGLNLLGLAAGAHVHLQHHVRPFGQSPGAGLVAQRRLFAGLPAQELSPRPAHIFSRIHSRISNLRILRIRAPR